MSKTLTIALNTFKEAIRDKTIISIGVVGFLLLAFSKIFIPISVGEGAKVIKDFGISIIEIFGVLVVILIGTRILYDEVERKTIYSIMSKPVESLEFVGGKFLGLYYLTIVVQVLLFFIFSLFYKLYLGVFEIHLLKILYFFLFEFFLLDALAIFLSAFTSPLTSGILTLVLFFIAHLSYYLITFPYVINAPELSWFFKFLFYILPNFSPFNIKATVVYHLPLPLGAYILAFSYSLLYSIILIILSSFLYYKKEFL
ncbi:MAG: ABC transporter permease subunit [candidate division WOR-3 bacterium]